MDSARAGTRPRRQSSAARRPCRSCSRVRANVREVAVHLPVGGDQGAARCGPGAGGAAIVNSQRAKVRAMLGIMALRPAATAEPDHRNRLEVETLRPASDAPSHPLALVTGASAGIGAAFARELAARGRPRCSRRGGYGYRASSGELEDRHRVRAVCLPADLVRSRGAAAPVRAAIDQRGITIDWL